MVKTKYLLGVILVGFALWGPTAALAVEDDAIDPEITASNRRHATFTYYAFHIAKLDATVSFCSGARTGYRRSFADVLSTNKDMDATDIMKSYDTRYEVFALGLGDYACPENEVEHYKERLARQIKNLQRDIKALE